MCVRFPAMVFLAALPAMGIPIYINDPSAVTNGAYGGTQRFEARFRVSDTAWDLGLGPALPVTGQKTANLGNVAAVLSPVWRFELRSDPTVGLRFQVQPSPTAPWTTLLWATSEEIDTWTPFERAFNTLRVQVYAIGNAATARNAVLEKVVLSTGPLQGYAEEQGLTDMTVTRTTHLPPSATSPAMSPPPTPIGSTAAEISQPRLGGFPEPSTSTAFLEIQATICVFPSSAASTRSISCPPFRRRPYRNPPPRRHSHWRSVLSPRPNNGKMVADRASEDKGPALASALVTAD